MKQRFQWAVCSDGIARPVLFPGLRKSIHRIRPDWIARVFTLCLTLGFFMWLAEWLEGDHRAPAAQTEHVVAGSDS